MSQAHKENIESYKKLQDQELYYKNKFAEVSNELNSQLDLLESKQEDCQMLQKLDKFEENSREL